MEHIPESGRTTPTATSTMSSDKLSHSPSKVPLTKNGSSFTTSTRKMPQSSSRSLMTTPPPPSRSGRATPPTQLLEMSVTEQIARKARKSTVLNDKNALLILAIPDYDDYKILQPYSCRSLTNKSKFIGGKDFITRHNPQEVSEFKKQYSRDVGNLNRHRSILAPPTTAGASQLLVGGGSSLSGSSSLAFFASQSLGSPSKTTRDLDFNSSPEVWRQAFAADQKPCWVLTDFGIESLIGPEYRITTRVPMLPALSPHTNNSSSKLETTSPSPHIPSLRSPLRPETPLALTSFTERESARIGFGVNLLDEKQLASLSRIAVYSPKSHPPSPPRSPYRAGPTGDSLSGALTERSPSKVHQFGHTLPTNRPATDPTTSPSHRSHLQDVTAVAPSLSSAKEYSQAHLSLSSATATDHHTHGAASPTTQPFAMEISPSRVALGTLRQNEVYLFPIRVRNVGFKQERFRVKHVGASCAGFEAAIAETSYDRESARLAPGLAAILTLTLCFQHPGKIFGHVVVETEGVGSCEVEIRGAVR